MKKLTKYTAFLLLCALSLPAKVFARELIPVGKVVGLELQDDTVTIAAFDESLGAAAKAAGVPIICSMGTGNKLHPECFCIEDISKTTVCPLARVMRRELKKRGIEGVKVLYSKEPAIAPKEESDEELLPGKHRITGSVAFVPSVAGLMLAGEVIRHIAGAE